MCFESDFETAASTERRMIRVRLSDERTCARLSLFIYGDVSRYFLSLSLSVAASSLFVVGERRRTRQSPTQLQNVLSITSSTRPFQQKSGE